MGGNKVPTSQPEPIVATRVEPIVVKEITETVQEVTAEEAKSVIVTSLEINGRTCNVLVRWCALRRAFEAQIVIPHQGGLGTAIINQALYDCFISSLAEQLGITTEPIGIVTADQAEKDDAMNKLFKTGDYQSDS